MVIKMMTVISVKIMVLKENLAKEMPRLREKCFEDIFKLSPNLLLKEEIKKRQ